MECSACQHRNRADARFCSACGAPLERRCPACQRALPADAVFCDGCGTRVAQPGSSAAPGRDARAYTPRHLAERILTSKSALEGERKPVAVLFADLANSTVVANRVDPEEMHALMDRCFQCMLEAVHRFEGTVNQFTGDGIMALFGAPIALEDAPQRAVRAALAIQRALEPLHREVLARHGVDFRMRIGIHNGLVVVGRIGDDLRMDYTAVGDTTNLASRLQQIAPPGGVVISATTQRLVSGFFALEALPATRLKGFAEDVLAFEVRGERAVEGRLEASAAGGLTPFVGREREIDDLLAAFESAQRGQGRVVFLVGEAGIGKSRLRFELRRRLAERCLWLEGRCASNTRDTAFHPIADALRRGLALEESDDDATALAKLERAEQEEGGELAWTLPLLRRLLSLPTGDAAVEEMDAATRRSETFRALQARLLRASARQPVVLAIEDLHWIDAASEEFLTYFSDSLPASRVLLLLTSRPGHAHALGDRSYHVRIALQSLSQHEMGDMARGMLHASRVPKELQDLIATRAEGNPLFVEEVTKSLHEQGVLALEGDAVVLRRALAEVSIPDSIHGVLMARLDRLADEPKRAMQVASVIGREFTLRLLERISEAGTHLTGIMRELRALELLVEKHAQPELAFMFKHALTHDVAYQSILVQRRKRLHEFAGRAIEELYRDRLAEHYEALAHHFSLAEIWERAFHYHEKASEKAAEAYANHAAAEHCRRALEIADRLAEGPADDRRRVLAERLGLSCWLVSEFRAAGEAYRRAAGYSRTPQARALNLGFACYALHWGHEYESARELLAESLSVARSHGLTAIEALGNVLHGFDLATTQGDVESYRAATAEANAQVDDDHPVAGFTLLHEGQIAEWCGEYHAAVALHERVLAAARRMQRPDNFILASWFLGKAYCCLGRYDEAFAQLEEALALADRIGDRAWKTRLLNTLGWCFAELGCHERAIACNEQSAELASRMLELELVPGAPELHGNAVINLGCNRIALGDLDGAAEQIAPVQERAARESDPWMRWRYGLHLHDALARLALARGEPESALPLLALEVEGARRHAAAKVEARALELEGRALLVLDRREASAQSLLRALEIGQRIGYPPVVWRADSLLAELARRGGDAERAARHADRARRRVSELAAGLGQPELRRSLGALGERLLSDPLAAYR